MDVVTAASSSRTPKPPTYVERLLADLDDIHAEYGKILAMSAIVNIDPNRRGNRGIVAIGFPKWGWADSSEERRVGKECPQLCRSRWSPYH